MAICEKCGKKTTFGHNRSFSQRATNRSYQPNLQKIMLVEQGHKVHKVMCARCIRSMVKSY